MGETAPSLVLSGLRLAIGADFRLRLLPGVSKVVVRLARGAKTANGGRSGTLSAENAR